MIYQNVFEQSEIPKHNLLFFGRSTKGYKPLMLIHKAYQHLHYISLVACYTKLSSPFAMANGVLTTNIADSHQATMNGFKNE